MFGHKSNFHPLEVVGRGSATQPQVGANINEITWREKGYYSQHSEAGNISPSWY